MKIVSTKRSSSSRLIFLTLSHLQVRVLLFLSTVTIGIVEGMSALEKSIPVALGYEANGLGRQSILRPSKLVTEHTRCMKPGEQALASSNIALNSILIKRLPVALIT